LFRKHGLEVILSRELGWATIRDKMVYGDLDASHAVAGMPFAATLGLGSIPCESLTGLVLNLHGNAITLSNELHRQGIRDAVSLRHFATASRHERTLTFGVVHPYSSHQFHLRQWLQAAGIQPDREVRIVVVPPPLMGANLRSGNLDGFCAGEPWNAVAAQAGEGWCVATSAELDPGHAEKVLMVRQEFAERRADEHVALIAALFEACRICQDPSHREEVLTLLAQSNYLGVAKDALRWGFEGRCATGPKTSRVVPDFNVFHGDDANEPSCDKAMRVMQTLRSAAEPSASRPFNMALAQKVFRPDILDQARSHIHHTATPSAIPTIHEDQEVTTAV